MIEVKLEDFQDKRVKLLKYASNLLRGRGFVEKDGELKAFSEDIVQNAYLSFHKCNLNAFVTEKHLENYLISVVYTEFLQTIDLNRRGAQYILGKDSTFDVFKTEFKQMNVRTNIDDFDVIDGFKDTLDKDQIFILDNLLKGFSKTEISRNCGIEIQIVKRIVDKIRVKYNKYETSTNN